MRAFLALGLLLAACGTDTFSSADGGLEGSLADSPAADGMLPDGGDARTLGSLVLWLDSSKSVSMGGGSRVAVWGDQSGNGNDAHSIASAPGPLVNATGIAGRPSLHFEAVSGVDPAKGCILVVDDKPTLNFGTANFLIEVVARWTNDPALGASTGRGVLFHKRLQYMSSSPGVTIFANNPVPATATGGIGAVVGTSFFGSNGTMYNDGTWRPIALGRDLVTTSLRAAGNADGMTGVGTQDVSPPPNVPLMIGAAGDAAGTFRLDGDIAEILVYVGKTPAPAIVEAYLKLKYNL